jgi:hypothetical protein
MENKLQAFEVIKWNGEEYECMCYATTKEQWENFYTTFPHKRLRRNSYCPATNTTVWIVE